MFKAWRIRVSAVFALLITAALLVSTSAWEVKSPLVCGLLFLFATILVGIGSLGRMWCSLYVAGYKRDRLIVEGPYSMCRNPLYFFSCLGALGIGFASETLLIPLVILVVFAIYYPGVIRHEESQLKRIHGEQFADYFNTVPRFFPRISYLQEPQEYVTKPIVFRKHIFSALWFIWLVGVVELIEQLHELEVLPNFFQIY
jgi:protein-S-isoprenylcysteine O-methyltransferase Ste14